MTTIITRYFESAAKARAARHELVQRRGLSIRIIRTFGSADGLADKLIAESVDPAAAEAYQERMAKGGAVLLVRAGHKPLAVAKTTREVTAAMGAVPMKGLAEESYVKDRLDPGLSILPDHPHMLLRPRDPDSTDDHMADWPIPLISRRKPATHSAFPPHMRMASFPIPLLYRDFVGEDYKPFTRSIFGRHSRMANWPIPLISRRKPYSGSIFARHARMANFPLPLISRRKPYSGTAIGRHTRMANWPFPLLINGKTGTNALMPGGPRMANFPISLLSSRKPFNKSIFPRHAHMANFPIGLISRRKPMTASIFPRHARMADALLPLVVKHGESERGGGGFSFSRMLGLKTISRR